MLCVLCFSKEVWILPWEVDKMEDMLLSTVTARSSYATDVRSSLPSTEMFVPDQLNSEVQCIICRVFLGGKTLGDPRHLRIPRR